MKLLPLKVLFRDATGILFLQENARLATEWLSLLFILTDKTDVIIKRNLSVLSTRDATGYNITKEFYHSLGLVRKASHQQVYRKVEGKMNQALGQKSDEGAKATLVGVELWLND